MTGHRIKIFIMTIACTVGIVSCGGGTQVAGGGIGGTGFSPIVNAPEVAILGLSQTRVKPV